MVMPLLKALKRGSAVSGCVEGRQCVGVDQAAKDPADVTARDSHPRRSLLSPPSFLPRAQRTPALSPTPSQLQPLSPSPTLSNLPDPPVNRKLNQALTIPATAAPPSAIRSARIRLLCSPRSRNACKYNGKSGTTAYRRTTRKDRERGCPISAVAWSAFSGPNPKGGLLKSHRPEEEESPKPRTIASERLGHWVGEGPAPVEDMSCDVDGETIEMVMCGGEANEEVEVDCDA